MQPKIILGPAWAAQEGMRDSDLASLFGVDLSNILPATDDPKCPRCGNPPADSKVQMFTYGPEAATPEKVSGHGIVRCLCETIYAYPCVHEMNAQQPIGEAQVRAVSAAAARHPDGLTINVSDAVVPSDFVSIIPGIPSGETFGRSTLS